MSLRLGEDSYKLGDIIDEQKLMSLKAIGMALEVSNQYSTIEDEEIQKIIEKIS
ncbi:hypothetical protein [Clostridium thermobutyricum]|uniref:hypothetical protein n=1 Tax=Clostridium thermobutyricum TaxID=29372 RepID=UPI001FADD15E|nr:hypothetical protein [Clostridium thermobutyricum]